MASRRREMACLGNPPCPRSHPSLWRAASLQDANMSPQKHRGRPLARPKEHEGVGAVCRSSRAMGQASQERRCHASRGPPTGLCGLLPPSPPPAASLPLAQQGMANVRLAWGVRKRVRGPLTAGALQLRASAACLHLALPQRGTAIAHVHSRAISSPLDR
ncbi:hypothetical protein IQ07DRAFT_11416 [Pyrenochaeta sp. DS3sAY3a]|nr:hypothetical protein IQ07DRAFT_11416 [Pyrenochaeta sp. DS3sAY3a]